MFTNPDLDGLHTAAREPKPDGNHGKDGGGAEASPGGCLLTLVGLDQPEGHPGGHHDDDERGVDLQDVESNGPVKAEVEEDHGLGGVPDLDQCEVY